VKLKLNADVKSMKGFTKDLKGIIINRRTRRDAKHGCECLVRFKVSIGNPVEVWINNDELEIL